MAALEDFSQAYSRASSLSYTAGVADFDSVNNFSKEEADSGSSEDANSNLNQAKDAIGQAKSSLDVIVGLLQKGQPPPPQDWATQRTKVSAFSIVQRRPRIELPTRLMERESISAHTGRELVCKAIIACFQKNKWWAPSPW